MSNRVIVIGAGAAGLMAAGSASALGADVLLIEKNQKVGRKIAITGKGRCNLANNCDVQTFIRNVPTNGKFLYSAINNFTPYDAIEFFEDRGLKTKTERGNRVFPLSDRALDVVDTMRDYALENGAQIINDTAVALIIKDGEIKGVKTENGKYDCDCAIVCCGGVSYPLTGSTGDGYLLAKQAGHTITEIKPSLVPLESDDKCCKDMQGLSLRNISVKIKNKDSGKVLYDDFGELLFTHFGLSGPTILSASSHIKNTDVKNLAAVIDLKPALSAEQLDARVLRDFSENINRDVSNSFTKLLPKKIVPTVLIRWGVPFNKKCNAITKEERQRLVKILKEFTISISGFRPVDEAIITSGGVKTSEINPKTMESKLCKGLYFAGEVIDVDAYTGGFNLQIAWSTGKLSGENAAYGKEE